LRSRLLRAGAIFQLPQLLVQVRQGWFWQWRDRREPLGNGAMVFLSTGPEDFGQPAQPHWITAAIAGLQGAQAIEVIAATKGRATLDQPLEQTQQRQGPGTA
jgi:hypothetical protein